MGLINGIKGIFSESTSKVVDKIGEAFDRNFTTAEEKGKIKISLKEVDKEIKEIQNETMLKLAEISQDYERQVTSRHKADMTSDNKLSKNIRPRMLWINTLFVMIYSIVGALVDIPEKVYMYTLVFWGTILVAQYTFYYGSRGIEKVMAIKGNLFQFGKQEDKNW